MHTYGKARLKEVSLIGAKLNGANLDQARLIDINLGDDLGRLNIEGIEKASKLNSAQLDQSLKQALGLSKKR